MIYLFLVSDRVSSETDKNYGLSCKYNFGHFHKNNTILYARKKKVHRQIEENITFYEYMHDTPCAIIICA